MFAVTGMNDLCVAHHGFTLVIGKLNGKSLLFFSNLLKQYISYTHSFTAWIKIMIFLIISLRLALSVRLNISVSLKNDNCLISFYRLGCTTNSSTKELDASSPPRFFRSGWPTDWAFNPVNQIRR